MKTLYFDCYSGAAGDMAVGALIDAGADFEKLRAALLSLGVGGFDVAVEKVKKKGVMATKFHVNIDESHAHPHRHLRHVVEIIEQGDLPDSVRAASIETFRRIGEAEAQVHGTTIEKVHFHEVGAVDSIVDIVGTHLALHELGIERMYASPLHVGSGTVHCAHGLMPVPAPATALLIQGIPAYGGAIEGELVTPTGAALIAQLATSFGPMPAMTIEKVGLGAGTRDLPDRPNVLRVLIGETSDTSPSDVPETIVVMEATIDDMHGELFPPLIEALLAAGARDAVVAPVLGKKGRPAQQVTVLCDRDKIQETASVLFRESTTLGVRYREEQRLVLARDWTEAETPYGVIRIKLGMRNGEVVTRAPEFEDCRKAAEMHQAPVRVVYEAALAALARGN
jgi:pyridinium-3,5-bisthiocarboxylic acid mononucleotide nickel chelatase